MKKYLLFLTLACAAVAQVKNDVNDVDWPSSTAGQVFRKNWANNAYEFATVSKVTASGLALTVAPFKAGDFVYAGGTINAVASKTQWLCVNLKTKALHCLPRNFDDGVIYLARVVANGSAVTLVDEFAPTLPATRIPRALARLQRGQAMTVGCFGSSLVEGGAGANGWQDYLFNIAQLSAGYVAGNIAVETATNGNFSAGTNVGWTAGGPTGYTIQSQVGPSQENAAEWAGAGRWFQQQAGPGNGAFTASGIFRKISGTPSVTILIKNFGDDTVKGTLNFSPGTPWEARAVSGTTDGASVGWRYEVIVTGGTIQFTNLSVTKPTIAVTNTNHGVGGSTPRYTAALLSRAVDPRDGTYDETVSINEGMRPAQYDLGFSALKASGPSLAFKYDLAIVACLANGGEDRYLVYEGIVRILRQANIEVLLLTDNAFAHAGDAQAQDLDSLWTDGAFIQQLANNYGCAVADTAAYMREGEWRGETVYTDTIHQNTAGHQKWAEAATGVLGHTVAKIPSASFRFEAGSQPLPATSWIPGRVDVQLEPTHNGTLTTGLGAGTNKLAAMFGGIDTQRIDLTTGKHVYVSHPLMLGADLVIDASTDFTADVKRTNGAVSVGSITYTNGGAGVRPQTVRLISSVFPGTGPFGSGPRNSTIEVIVTSGTLKLYGVAVHTADYVDVTDDLVTIGTWAKEAAAYGNAKHRWTDTSGDQAMLEYTGKSLVAIYTRRSASGIVQEINNGVKPATNDLYSTGNYTQNYLFSARTYGRNQWGVRYTGTNNVSAGSTAAGNRRLAIVQVLSIRDR